MNFTFFKKHPVAAGVVVIIGGIIVFMIFRANSGGSSNTADGSVATGDSTGYSSDPRIAAIQAGANIQQGQQQGQLQMATLQADVINNQTIAALQATKLSAERDISLAEIQTSADVAKATIASETQIETVHTQAAAYESAISASTEQARINANASVTMEQDTTAAKLQLDNAVIGLVRSGQLNKGGSGGAHQQATIGELLGFGPGPTEQTGQVATVAGSPGAILSGIAGVAKGIFGGLFG